MFLGLPDSDPDPLVRVADPDPLVKVADPDPDPSLSHKCVERTEIMPAK
jgi:hypothetical protein